MLYLIRHGKTEWNLAHKLQGQSDIPLSDFGRVSAREAAVRMKNVHLDICYSSPLSRAAETAQILLEGRDIPIILDDRLKEMNFGRCEGSHWQDSYDDPALERCFKDPVHYEAVEGGESFEELFARTGSFLKEVVLPEINRGKDILIVGHGAMNHSIVCRLWNKPLADFWQPEIKNCSLIRVL